MDARSIPRVHAERIHRRDPGQLPRRPSVGGIRRRPRAGRIGVAEGGSFEVPGAAKEPDGHKRERRAVRPPAGLHSPRCHAGRPRRRKRSQHPSVDGSCRLGGRPDPSWRRNPRERLVIGQRLETHPTSPDPGARPLHSTTTTTGGSPMRFVHIFSPAIRVLSGLGLVLLIPVLTGCSPAIGKVSGKVTYKGQPVPGGLITFRPADPAKNSITVELDTEGRYSATLPAGDVTVIIDNRELEPRPSMPSMPAGIPLSAEAQAKLRGKAPRPPPRRTGGRRRARTFGDQVGGTCRSRRSTTNSRRPGSNSRSRAATSRSTFELTD